MYARLVQLELTGTPPRPLVEATVRELISAGEAIPENLRPRLWASLLDLPTGADAETRFALDSAAIASVQQDLPNQRVVKVDAERTRQDLGAFKTDEMRARVVQLLTYFVKGGYTTQPSDLLAQRPPQGIPYLQGINEPLVPFLMLGTNGIKPDIGLVNGLFSRFIARFAPRLYLANDPEFNGLQCSLRLFRLLLQYHDPQLCSFLDSFDCVPELYATPWFLTLMSRGNELELVCQLFDFLLATAEHPGPSIMHAVAVAFLISYRTTVLSTMTEGINASELPLVLSRLCLASPTHVRQICGAALDLWAETPVTFRKLVHSVCYSGGPVSGDAGPAAPASSGLLSQLERRIALKVSVDEIVESCSGRGRRGAAHSSVSAADLSPSEVEGPPSPPPTPSAPATGLARLLRPPEELAGPPRFIVIDVRPKLEYEHGGHLPTAFHLDPALLDDPEAFTALISSLAALKGTHLAVMGPGNLDAYYHLPVLPPASPTKDGRGGPAPAVAAAAAAAAAASSSSALEEALTLEREDHFYGGDGDVTRSIVLFFLQRGFHRVSEVAGGFVALHQHQSHFLDSVLVGHSRDGLCLVCSGGAAAERYREMGGGASSEWAHGRGSPSGLRRPASGSDLGSGGSDAGALSALLPGGLALPGAAASAAASAVTKRASALTSWLRSITEVPEGFDGHHSGTSGGGSGGSHRSGSPSVHSHSASSPGVPSAAVHGSAPVRSVSAPAAVSAGLPRPPSSPGLLYRQMSLDEFMSQSQAQSEAHSQSAAALEADEGRLWAAGRPATPSGGPPAPLRGGTEPSATTPSVADGARVSSWPCAEPDWLIVGYDKEGLPMLSETAQLELQCDAIVHSSAASPSGGHGSAGGSRQAPGSGLLDANARAKLAAVASDPDYSPYDKAIDRRARQRGQAQETTSGPRPLSVTRPTLSPGSNAGGGSAVTLPTSPTGSGSGRAFTLGDALDAPAAPHVAPVAAAPSASASDRAATNNLDEAVLATLRDAAQIALRSVRGGMSGGAAQAGQGASAPSRPASMGLGRSFASMLQSVVAPPPSSNAATSGATAGAGLPPRNA